MEKCQICGKNHQRRVKRIITHAGKKVEVEILRSPCLDAISQEAIGLVNQIVNVEGKEHKMKCPKDEREARCTQCERTMTKLEVIMLGHVCGPCCRKNHKKVAGR